MSPSTGTGSAADVAGCELQATAAGRALHALEPGDERLIDAHLPHCEACRETLRESASVAAWLAVAVPDAEPPPGLRERVLALAEAPDDRRAGPRPSAPPKATPAVTPREPVDPGSTVPPAAAPTVPTPRVTTPSSARSARRWSMLAVAAVVLGVVILSARALLPGAVQDTAAPPTSDSSVLTDRAARIVQGAEAADPAGHQATLRDQTDRPVAVVVDDAGGARVVPLALPAPPSGTEYFLWRVVGTRTLPMGAVDPTAVARAEAGTTDGPVAAYAISREGAGASPTAPGDLVAVGPAV